MSTPLTRVARTGELFEGEDSRLRLWKGASRSRMVSGLHHQL